MTLFDKRQLQMQVLVTPEMSNFSGEMHGGDLLKILDRTAYTAALRYTGKDVVTLSVDRVLFKQPIHIGELVTLLANVNYTGRTSLEIGIKVIAEDMKNQSVRHTNSCFFTMVAVENGKTVLIDPLNPSTEEEKRRFEEAVERRRAAGLF
tara:strand:- start:202 stop:651 length:450 start_codon:yes stop_codon:yes gene_type:complete